MRISLLLPILVALFVPKADAFPADEDWAPISRSGNRLADDSGDPSPDLIGDADDSGLHFWADATTWSVRVRLVDPTALGSNAVAVAASVDGEHTTLEYLVVADGGANEVALYTSNGVAGTQPTWTRADGVALASASTVSAGYLDFEIPRSLLEAEGWAPDLPSRLVVFAGSAPGTWTDILGCADLACAPEDLLSGAVYVDQDLDGYTNVEERAFGTNFDDADSDDDGVIDGLESVGDTDEDGTIDALDCDSDNDAIGDGVELGVDAAGPGTNEESPCFRVDADPTTQTDPLSMDTDGGGLFDATEDVNRNGAVDAWETDPNNPADDTDTDADGIADVLELAAPDANVDDVDSDGDGVSDAAEWLWDPDGDGIPAFLDDDSDGDGFTDVEEGEVDTDEDGVVDAIDPDSDGDGRDDVDEGRGDLDCDGVENRIDANDFDGYCDTADVSDGFEDEDIDRPAGELDRGCSHAPASVWLAPFVLLVLRRRA